MDYSIIFKMTIVLTIVGSCLGMILSYIVVSLGYMKCMQKAGEQKWKAWVPFYNDFIMYKIVGLNSWLVTIKVAFYIITVVYLCIYVNSMNDITNDYKQYIDDYKYENVYSIDSTTSSYELSRFDTEKIEAYMDDNVNLQVVNYIKNLLAIAFFIIGIFFAIKIAKAYGLGGGYIAGMILVPGIFILIIGFGKSQYNGILKNV